MEYYKNQLCVVVAARHSVALILDLLQSLSAVHSVFVHLRRSTLLSIHILHVPIDQTL